MTTQQVETKGQQGTQGTQEPAKHGSIFDSFPKGEDKTTADAATKDPTGKEKVAALKSDGIKPIHALGWITPVVLIVLAIGLWVVSPVAALVVGVIAVALLILALVVRYFINRAKRKKQAQQNQNKRQPNQRQPRQPRQPRNPFSRGPNGNRPGSNGRQPNGRRNWPWSRNRDGGNSGRRPWSRRSDQSGPRGRQPNGNGSNRRWPFSRRDRANNSNGGRQPNQSRQTRGRQPRGNSGRQWHKPWTWGNNSSGGGRGRNRTNNGGSGNNNGGRRNNNSGYGNNGNGGGRGRQWYKPWTWGGNNNNGGRNNNPGVGSSGQRRQQSRFGWIPKFWNWEPNYPNWTPNSRRQQQQPGAQQVPDDNGRYYYRPEGGFRQQATAERMGQDSQAPNGNSGRGFRSLGTGVPDHNFTHHSTSNQPGVNAMSDTGSVSDAVIGREEAAAHSAGSVANRASALAHIILSNRFRNTAVHYANSNDPHHRDLASIFAQKASRAASAAENRLGLAAGHDNAAARAITSGQ